MTTLDTAAEAVTAAGDARTTQADTTAQVDTAAVARPFVERLLTTTDHKVLGTMLIGDALLAAVAVTVLGALLGIERVGTSDTMLRTDAVDQLFGVFRFGLVFGVLIPLLLGAGLAAVPLQVGARAVAFGRLAAFGVWIWFVGIVLVIIAYAGNGGAGGGNSDMVDLFYVAFGLVCVGLVAVAVALATTTLTTRAPGMTMRRVPVFTWSVLVTSLGVIVVLPATLGALVLLFVDHRFSRQAFGTGMGSADVVRFVMSQPATFIFALPVVGLAAELLPVAMRSRQPGLHRQVTFLGIGLVIFAALGAAARYTPRFRWLATSMGNRMDDVVLLGLFVLLPTLGVLIVIGTGALLVNGSEAKSRPRPKITGPFAFASGALILVLIGMLTTLLYSLVDLHLEATVFEEAGTVYLVYGGVLGGLGAVTYWAPKWLGRTIGDKEAMGLAGLGFVATILASAPHLLAGLLDQPANAAEFDADGPLALLNLIVTAGHLLMLVVVLGAAGLVAKACRADVAEVVDDPWEGQTLEWSTASPAPEDNFAETPTVTSAQPMLDRRATPDDVAASAP